MRAWRIILLLGLLLGIDRDAFALRAVDPEKCCTRVLDNGVSRARYYSPQIGRFWTRDTEEGDQEEPKSLHLYNYCYADPVNRADPSGHLVEDPLFAGFLNVNMTQRDGARVGAGRAMAMKSIAMTTAVMAIIAIETLPLGEVQPQPQPEPDPIPAPPGTDPRQWNPNLLYRVMKPQGSGPKVGDRFAELGVRPEKDFLAPLGPGRMVNPGNGGLSVFLGTPMNIRVNFRPSILGGQGKYPLWGIHASFFYCLTV